MRVFALLGEAPIFFSMIHLQQTFCRRPKEKHCMSFK